MARCKGKYFDPNTETEWVCLLKEGHKREFGISCNFEMFGTLVSEGNLNKKELQNLRIILMMYRQGWVDAIAALKSAAIPVDKDITEVYNRLVEWNKDSER